MTVPNRPAPNAGLNAPPHIVQWARDLPIRYDFPSDADTARRLGFQHWLHRTVVQDSPYFPFPYEHHPQHHIDRWAVNWLRHQCSNYDRTLTNSPSLTRGNPAYPIIKNRILGEIARRFPELAEAAEIQKEPEP